MCALFVAVPASADPIAVTLTTGVATAGPFDPGGEILAWGTEGFVFDASNENSNLSACCRQGDTVSFSMDLSGPFFGTASIHGQHYIFGPNEGDAVWRFDTPSLTLPAHATGPVELAVPFSLLPDSHVLFPGSSSDRIEVTLTGSGRAFGSFSVSHPEGEGGLASYALENVRYEFGRTNPVPEPTSLLLFASGAALGWRRRPV